jgi:TRAP-type C4-dicarboxylate transport system permease small subunit
VGGGGEGAARVSERGARALRAIDGACEALAHAGMVLISIFMLLQMVEIVGRKAFGYSILGLSEIGQLFVMSCICLTWPLVFCRDGHIAVEFVTDMLPPRGLWALKAMLALVGTIFVGALLYYGIDQARLQIAKGDISPTLHIPVVWYWVPLLLAIAASGVACVAQTIRHAAATVSGRVAPPSQPGQAA